MVEFKDIINKRRRDFNISVSLLGVIPFLVFLYLVAVRIASIQIFVGEIGYIAFITVIIFITGLTMSKRLLWSMLNEIIEKNKLAAITETAMALSHEINNPLLTISGNLELLQNDLSSINIPEKVNNRISVIMDGCERIRKVSNKITKLSRLKSTTIYGPVKMIDLEKSE